MMQSLVWKARQLKSTYDTLKWASPTEHACTICNFRGYFRSFGWPIRPEARCPSCGSLERHRLLKLYTLIHPECFKDRKALHIAPEQCVTPFLRSLAGEYVTSNFGPDCDIQLDIEKMKLPDCSFDLILCSHVLEHVRDDLALKEFHRVLTPGGVALLMVPVVPMPQTYEDERVVEPDDRTAHFGQCDHVRRYGMDFPDRVASAGFSCELFVPTGLDSVTHGLLFGEVLFIAHKL